MSQRITAVKFHCPNDSRGSREHQVAAEKLRYTIHSDRGMAHLIEVKFLCPWCKQEHRKILKGVI